MRDPAGEEEEGCRGGKVRGALGGMDMQEIADVIEGHDDHDQSAGDVDSGDPFHSGFKIVRDRQPVLGYSAGERIFDEWADLVGY